MERPSPSTSRLPSPAHGTLPAMLMKPDPSVPCSRSGVTRTLESASVMVDGASSRHAREGRSSDSVSMASTRMPLSAHARPVPAITTSPPSSPLTLQVIESAGPASDTFTSRTYWSPRLSESRAAVIVSDGRAPPSQLPDIVSVFARK